MNPLTRRDILAHQNAVPWPVQRQVEQDLLLCLAMAALFNDKFLSGQIAMRGGTLLHKVHLAPAARYSEDIDLVIYGNRPENHIEKAIKRVLKGVFGDPTDSLWDKIQLAIRNQAKPSRVLRLTYSIPSASEPGANLDVVVEANATERHPHRQIVQIPFAFSHREAVKKASLNGYDLHEMLGTKMRALFQRRRGRDLFDLFWALTQAQPAIDPSLVIESFRHYLEKEGSHAGRDEFIGILDGHLANPGFCNDMVSLLRVGLDYDPQAAGIFVKQKLLALLPA
jgi:predicted nucleotidyltransferase component of viral defense system